MSVLDWVGVGIVGLVAYVFVGAYVCGRIEAKCGRGADESLWSIIWPLFLLGLCVAQPANYLNNLGFTVEQRRAKREKERLGA